MNDFLEIGRFQGATSETLKTLSGVTEDHERRISRMEAWHAIMARGLLVVVLWGTGITAAIGSRSIAEHAVPVLKALLAIALTKP